MIENSKISESFSVLALVIVHAHLLVFFEGRAVLAEDFGFGLSWTEFEFKVEVKIQGWCWYWFPLLIC